MAEIRSVIRASNVLRQPALPCLSCYYTINLLAGCPYECRYCYARSFRSHPGDDIVHFYANTFDLLQKELPRKRKKPTSVYFSTACEPFAPYQEILETLYDIMALLLENGISILISTKSSISDRFLKLFAANPGLVHVQVGLTMSDDRIRRILEPNAFSVEKRLETLMHLYEHGISFEVRMDPLIPGLTDEREAFSRLCKRVASCGVKRAAASYLFLRQANYRSMMELKTGNWSFQNIYKDLYTEQVVKYCGNNSIRIPDPEYRRSSYRLLKKLACEYGISLSLCKCKNPDVTNESCHPVFPSHQKSEEQMTLFD